MDVPSTVLPKEVPRLPVFLRVLVHNQVIKERDDLVACLFEMIHGDVEDKIVTVLVSIAIVEFLEVIEVRITHGELLTHTKTFEPRAEGCTGG